MQYYSEKCNTILGYFRGKKLPYPLKNTMIHPIVLVKTTLVTLESIIWYERFYLGKFIYDKSFFIRALLDRSGNTSLPTKATVAF